MENLSFQYPSWYILLCVLLGLTFALVLYYKDKTFEENKPVVNYLLGAFRFLAVTLIAILLLQPLLTSIRNESKKPVVILAQDQSESVGASMSEEEQTVYQEAFKSLAKDLGRDYELREYAFGDEVREGVDFVYEDKVSNISSVLNELFDLYSNQNLGAVVLSSDGIYNQGSNPLYSGAKLGAPVYTIALGDTTIQMDLVLKRVFHNKIAYLGDKFNVQIDVSAQNCSGKKTNLSVYKIEQGRSPKKLQEISLEIDKNEYFNSTEVILDAEQSGVQQYRIALSALSGETTRANNSKDIFIDVLDARQKILILADSPHPDLSALKQTITVNKNYEVEIAYAETFGGNLSDYDLLILHQLPSAAHGANAQIVRAKREKIPILFIVGTQTSLNRFNGVQNVLTILGDGRNTNEVQASFSGNFQLFTLGEELVENLPSFAPLTAPFGDFKASGDAEVLLSQRIGKINTQYPLLLFGEQDGSKLGILAAEGIWKWRLYNYLQYSNHEIVDEILGKTIQYASLKEDKRKFRASLSKNVYNENEAVVFDAELYNDTYELINDPDAGLLIRSEDDKEYNYIFNKTEKAYTLNAGILPSGNYTYVATTELNGRNLSFNGRFSVQPVQLELYETTADHGMLKSLSEKFGGAMVYPSELSSISNLISEKEIKPVIYENTRTRPVINIKLLFFIALILLTVEWFLRRLWGGY